MIKLAPGIFFFITFFHGWAIELNYWTPDEQMMIYHLTEGNPEILCAKRVKLTTQFNFLKNNLGLTMSKPGQTISPYCFNFWSSRRSMTSFDIFQMVFYSITDHIFC